ncbi:glycosyltransferase [Croceivirga thetidis]|uniref:Glycosyltransferase n=1 Tax=Croceivirga thetidis TaxID=2721623 RepID=A0ABX1GSI7_9FLAO|nr:glycosyltransferase [Croceivirga thetidis]NKI32915.1 glycosyltransferase [Croceivirga thetidis]
MSVIVFFCPTDTWGGVEKNVLLRAKQFGLRGYDVHIVLLKNTFKERFKNLTNVSVIEISSRGGDLNLFVIINYYRLLKKLKAKVAFAALKKDWWLVSFAAYLAKIPKIVLYLGIKRTIRNGFKYKLVFNLFNSKVLVNSDSLKNHLINSNTLFTTKNVYRIYNGFKIPVERNQNSDLKSKLGLPEGAFIIGCAGRFSLQKGFDQLPKIISHLPENFHIVHAGEGPLKNEIHELVAQSKFSNRIHFLGYQNNMSAFFSGLDTFLLCSRFEGMANVLNEAMSHGKPVVSTRVEGSEELLGFGKYGIIVDIDDTKSMAEALIGIEGNSIEFNPLVLRQRIENDFSIKQMIDNSELLFFG